MRTIRLPEGNLLGRREITTGEATGVVRSYWSAHGAPVWDFFEEGLGRGHDEVRTSDLLSLAALNARADMAVLARLWNNREAVEDTRRKVAAIRQIYGRFDDIDEVPPADRDNLAASLAGVLEGLRKVSGWKDTRVSKLVYRLLPRLVCIWDEKAGACFYPKFTIETAGTGWTEWNKSVFDYVVGNGDDLREVRANSGRAAISLLRTWDVLLWTLWKVETSKT